MQILVIEDEPGMAGALAQGLEDESYNVLTAEDGQKGLELARSAPFDLIVLDLMLPKLDGFQVARQLRQEGNQTPILVLTARDDVKDMVRALDLGADDYLTKPFSFEEFLARVRAVSRRGPIPSQVVLRVSDLAINTATREVTRSGRNIDLTAKEYKLLELLARQSPRVLSRDAILDAVWGFGAEVTPNNLEAFVRLLRSKLELAGESKLIRTVRGVGYSLRAEDQG
jgi:DNA-binding response OmpR family regulator